MAAIDLNPSDDRDRKPPGVEMLLREDFGKALPSSHVGGVEGGAPITLAIFHKPCNYATIQEEPAEIPLPNGEEGFDAFCARCEEIFLVGLYANKYGEFFLQMEDNEDDVDLYWK